MHIMEGYLDPIWCAVWFILAIPFIVPKGRKGGSNIAATICNSMIYYKG